MSEEFTIAGQNFRGIHTATAHDRRMLRPGLLFRSGDLSDLTERCVEELKALGIRSVIDLRSVSERQRHPYSWLLAVDDAAWGDPAQDAVASVSALFRGVETNAEDVAERMRAVYRELPFSHAQSYAALFRRIAEGRVPVLFGCTAGKDRTGVAAALLLWSIGIEFEEIARDYLASNQSFDSLKALAERKYGWVGSPKIDVALRADRDFLQSAIEAVNARCGGIDAYVHDTLGITSMERGAIERELLH